MAKFISKKCTHKCNKHYVIYFIPYLNVFSIINPLLSRLFPNFRMKKSISCKLSVNHTGFKFTLNLEFELYIEIDHF